MGKKIYAVVGGWGFRGGVRGLSTYRCDPATSKLSLIEAKFPDLAVGNQFYDANRGIVYVTDETKDQRGRKGGGGCLCAVKIDRDSGTMELLSQQRSLLSNPSYVWLDRSGRYALVSHHVTDSYITRLVRNENGGYSSQTLFEQAALVLFPVMEDGSLGKACDAYITEAEDKELISHQHCVIADPSGNTYVVCDKGLDRLYTFQIDRERGKLLQTDMLEAEAGSHPRYGAFHPSLPYFYGNNEEAARVCRYRVDSATGQISYVSGCEILDGWEEGKKPAPSDLVIDREGTCLYVSVRGTNQISVIALDGAGDMSLIQTLSCQGENPRGLCLSLDGRFLYVCNVDSNRINSFAVKPDHTLSPAGIAAEASRPGNMSLFITE